MVGTGRGIPASIAVSAPSETASKAGMPRSGLPLALPPLASLPPTSTSPRHRTLPPGPLTTCCASSWGGLDPSEAKVLIPTPSLSLLPIERWIQARPKSRYRCPLTTRPLPSSLLPVDHFPLYLQPAGLRASCTGPRGKGIRLVTLLVGHTVTPPPLPLSPLVAPLPLGLLHFQQQ